MHQRERALEAFVGEVGIELAELVGREHALVDDDPAAQRREVRVALVFAALGGIYLGGGFPEVHAPGLSDNAPLRAELYAAVEAGVPTVAECAGLLYLAETLDGRPMAAALPVQTEMTTVSYRL